MISKPIHQLKLADLQTLIGSARESKTLEFKREMPAGTSDEKIKFLAAVSALANTAGGKVNGRVRSRARPSEAGSTRFAPRAPLDPASGMRVSALRVTIAARKMN
jgi:hypothetical protein